MNEHSQEKNIFVNKTKKLRVVEATLTGAEILQRAEFEASQYDLFLVKGQVSNKIEPSQEVEIENGLHFNAILKSVPYG